jgi:hypothetical protein
MFLSVTNKLYTKDFPEGVYTGQVDEDTGKRDGEGELR